MPPSATCDIIITDADISGSSGDMLRDMVKNKVSLVHHLSFFSHHCHPFSALSLRGGWGRCCLFSYFCFFFCLSYVLCVYRVHFFLLSHGFVFNSVILSCCAISHVNPPPLHSGFVQEILLNHSTLQQNLVWWLGLLSSRSRSQ